jgi:hypothetical protein
MRLHTQFDPRGPVTFFVTGALNAACISELDYVFGAARRLGKMIRVDLSRATDIDRTSLKYLADQSADVTVVYQTAAANQPG